MMTTLGTREVEMAEARMAIAEATETVAALVECGEPLSAPVPGLDWTAWDTVAHLVTATQAFEDFATGKRRAEDDYLEGEVDHPPNERTAAVSARLIAAFAPGDSSQMAARLREAAQSFLATTESMAPERPFHSWEGDYDVGTATDIVLGELVVHGYDVARALGRRFDIPAGHARLAIRGGARILPEYVNRDAIKGVRATFELRLGAGLRIAVRVKDGSLTTSEGRAGDADCRISADPVSYLLVGFGRIGTWAPLLRGKLLAWGRKPWLAFRFTTMFHAP